MFATLAGRQVLAKVSVIVPTRQSIRTIEICLKSIAAQTHRDIDIIVVDSASSDGTVEKAVSFGAMVLQFPPDAERTYKKNEAARGSDAQFLLFLDSDIELTKDVVAECLKACNYSDAVIIPQHVASRSGYWAKCRALEILTYDGDNLVESPTFFRKEAFFAAGAFDERLVFGEENDLGLRVRKMGFRVARTKSYVWHHEGSLTGVIMRKFYYGRTAPRYLKKAGSTALVQFGPVRLAWFRNRQMLTRDPLHAAGMVAQKLIQYLAAGIGLGFGLFEGLTGSLTRAGDNAIRNQDPH